MIDRRGSNGRLRDVLGLAISAVSLAAFVWWATKQESPEFPTGGRELLELGVCLVIYTVATLLRGWRWHTILRHAHVDHARTDAYALTVVGYMGNNVLPARSGELLRVFLLGGRSNAAARDPRHDHRRAVPRPADDRDAVRGADRSRRGGGRSGSARSRSSRCPRWPARRARAAEGGPGRAAVSSGSRRWSGRSRTRRGSWWAGAAWLLAAVTVAVWLLEAVIFWLVGDSLHLGITPVEALFLVVLTSFVAIIPSAPGYIGTFEAAVVFGLNAIGIEGGQASRSRS